MKIYKYLFLVIQLFHYSSECMSSTFVSQFHMYDVS